MDTLVCYAMLIGDTAPHEYPCAYRATIMVRSVAVKTVKA